MILRFQNRWKRDIPESTEQLCAHMHVLLLYDVSDGATIPKIPVVEKVYDRTANCE